MPENSLMPIGQVVGAHGLNGAVKVHFFDDRLRTFSGNDTLSMVLPDGDRAVYRLKWARPHKRNYLIGLEGIDDRNQAQALQGARIVVRRSDLPALEEEDTFYWVDLIGMDVYTLEDQCLGKIASILPTGSNDVYVVCGEQGETLVPALKTVVVDVDFETHTMRVDLPEGL